MNKAFLTIILFCFSFYNVIAQKQDEIRLADEYYQQGEYEKARIMYEKLARQPENIPYIHKNYLTALAALKDHASAEKYLKKTIKENPEMSVYKADYAMLLQSINKKEDARKLIDKSIKEIAKNENKTRIFAQYLTDNGQYEWAEASYLEARKLHPNKSIFSYELANIYTQKQEFSPMFDELLNFINSDINNLEFVKTTLQTMLQRQEEYVTLEKILVNKVQNQPNELAYPELLIWLYVQEKNFIKAFYQARALDKRYKQGGEKIMDLGLLAFTNKAYEESVLIFEYIIQNYQKSVNYVIAKNYIITVREEQIRNTYPIDLQKVQALINDYNQLYQEVGANSNTAESLRNMAILYAFYFDKKDTAIKILEKVINFPQMPKHLISKYKIDIGDIYLLKEEPWEATLLYSQVEKSEKEQTIGHEAKLRNAKLHYYKGDFKLAQSHLDILKLATSREIANDALQLSILIQDNTGLDSTEKAMQAYAAIDLLLFQNKKEEALSRFDDMLKKFPGHSLSDEIYFQKAKIYIETGQIDKALENLNILNENYSHDIYGDDALFLTAQLYEENFNDKAKAVEIYHEHLKKFPGSIFNAEARKRLRKLRGDSVN